MKRYFNFCLFLVLTLVGGLTAEAQEFRVTEAILKADDAKMSGKCPIRVNFTGYITANGAGTVKYTFLRNDGATAPVYTIDFKQAGTQTVATDWTLGDAALLPFYEGWQTIKILSPNESESSRETGKFSISCGTSPDPQKPPKNDRQISFSIDQSLKPKIYQIPAFEGTNETRPVARLAGPGGTVTDFVENELIIFSDDQTVLRKILDRYNGKLLGTISFGNDKIAAQSSGSNAYLVRIDASGADPNRISNDFQALSEIGSGEHRVSTEAGLKLVAAAVNLKAEGFPVSPNFLLYPFQTTSEARVGLSAGWNSSAGSWSYMNQGGAQNLGIARAWVELQNRGRFGNRVRAAVLDNGFERDADVPAGAVFVGRPGRDLGVGESRFPGAEFHGANVTDALTAVQNNNFGAAGAAGGLIDPLMVERQPDTFGIMGDLSRVAASNPRIINMSFGNSLPALVAVFVGKPLNIITRGLRGRGILLFAAAPNEGDKDIDATDGFLGATWERDWSMPCENDGVICVGGMGDGTRERDVDSAFASRFGAQPTSIDIFGPFNVWVSDDPEDRRTGRLPATETSGAEKVSGNSFATPTVAGIAALIWAANPRLSADEVERILFETAQRGSAPTDVPLRPNAHAAVCRALGGCSAGGGTTSDTTARFRITINGFVCNRPTRDDLGQTDGVDDEVFVRADLSLFDRSTNRNQPGAQSLVMGDSNRQPGRIRAGSGFNVFGGNGGFKEGDTFPAGGTPWVRSGAAVSDRPPLAVWEGELTRDENALALIPSLWETDNDPRTLGTEWISSLAGTFAGIGSEMRLMIARRAGHAPSAELSTQLRRFFDAVRVSEGNDPKDRPVGMDDRGEHLGYTPQMLVLTYDAASRLAATDFGQGAGVLPLRFQDQGDFRGDYTLFIQIERVR